MVSALVGSREDRGVGRTFHCLQAIKSVVPLGAALLHWL